MEREYSTASLWSKVGGKVVIPEPIAKYLENFGDLRERENKAWAVHHISRVGFGHFPEDMYQEAWRFSEDDEEHLKYRKMFQSAERKFDILRAAVDGYLVHAPKVAVRFGTKFAKTLEVDSELTSMTYQWITHREDEYGCMRSYVLTLSDYPEPWNYRDALMLQEDFGGEIVKYG
ncbi:hypothetical protein EC99P1_00021 [Enterococcus phage EC99P1]|nr:hypothetical protein EC99P1_00021 [Enterococcus phage EC99P1]